MKWATLGSGGDVPRETSYGPAVRLMYFVTRPFPSALLSQPPFHATNAIAIRTNVQFAISVAAVGQPVRSYTVRTVRTPSMPRRHSGANSLHFTCRTRVAEYDDTQVQVKWDLVLYPDFR